MTPTSRATHPTAHSAPRVRPDPTTLEIVTYPAPVLKKRAHDVPQVDPWVQAVIQRMVALMIKHEGVGLAAPQVNLPLRLFVWSPSGNEEDARAIINPIISMERGEVEAEEGCLSLPDIRIKVHRFQSIHLEGLDERGEPMALDLADFPARVAQHETDHLDGILLLDRMSPVVRLANRRKIKEMVANAEAAKKG